MGGRRQHRDRHGAVQLGAGLKRQGHSAAAVRGQPHAVMGMGRAFDPALGHVRARMQLEWVVSPRMDSAISIALGG